MEFKPYHGLHIIMMSRQEVERYSRHAYNVPANVSLGWTPYTILIQSYGATAYIAFYSVKALRVWLGSSFRVKLAGPWQSRGIRVGRIVASQA